MKIAFIVSQFPSLSETFIVQQITGLLKKKYTVRILSFSRSTQNQTQDAVIRYGLIHKTTYISLPKKKWHLRLKGFLAVCTCFIHSPKTIYHLLKSFLETGFSYHDLFLTHFVLRHHIDLMHAHFGPNGNRCIIIKKIRPKTRLLITFHGYDVTVTIRQQGEHVYDELFSFGDVFMYNSEATKQKLLALGCPEKKMCKLPMAINLEHCPFQTRILKPAATIRLLSVGRLVEMKGREYAIKAVNRLKDKYSIQYDIIGDGDLRKELQGLIDDFQLNDIVQLRGPVSSEQLKSLYEQAHIFIHPSVTASNGNQEGQGVVLLEAQAHGIPVIATQHGAFPDSMIDGETGFLVPERDDHALADMIEKLIQNSDTWPEIGTKGRDFVKNNFNSIRLNQQLEDIYQTAFAYHSQQKGKSS